MNFNSGTFKEWEKIHQYVIPSKCYYIAEQYGNELTFNEILNFYKIAVTEVLMFYKIETLGEIPFGKARVDVKCRWIEKMTSCLQRRKERVNH